MQYALRLAGGTSRLKTLTAFYLAPVERASARRSKDLDSRILRQAAAKHKLPDADAGSDPAAMAI